MPTTETATQRLASLLLGQPVTAWIAQERSEGRSWRQVAADLKVATNGQIEITHEAARGWHEEIAA
jgi:hypothetical protein